MTKLPATTPDTPKPAWAEGLSARELKFILEYLVDLHGGNAAERAGLGRTRKSSIEIASKLKKKLAEQIAAAITERSGIAATAVIGELGAVAFSKITDYLKLENGRILLAVSDLNDLPDEAKAAISKLRERVRDDGTITIEVELHDKIQALDRLGKTLGIFREKSEVEHNHNITIDADPLDVINARLDQLAKAQRATPALEIDGPIQRALPPPDAEA